MTTVTSVFGLLPLILFVSDDLSVWYSLALSAIGGLLSSMVLVLMLIPVLYFGRKKLKPISNADLVKSAKKKV